MMKKLSKLLIILVVLAMFAGCFTACDVVNSILGNDDVPDNQVGDVTGGEQGGEEQKPNNEDPDDGKVEIEFVDYASQIKFNPNSGRIWAQVKVRSYIDGDTTHFETIDGTNIDGVDYVKARYLSINTPESTGIIEPWGKKASNYTKAQLMQATDIIIESDSDEWNLDSTGGRYLLWVWYKTAEDTEYRNLNLEILQQGLAYGSNVSSNVYGETAFKILNQSKNLKLHVFDRTAKDPDFYYGKAVELSLKELKASIYWSEEDKRFMSEYDGMLVKFEAVVAKNFDGSTIYVEEYDAANDMYFGMQIFTGYAPIDYIFDTAGNRVSIVGTLQYWENGDTYQISNLEYKLIDPDWEGGCRIISTGHSVSYREMDVDKLLNGTVTLETVKEVEGEDGEFVETVVTKEFKYAELAHYSTATISNLEIVSVYTTTSDTDSNGALTITCRDQDGNVIQIRTAEQLTKMVDGTKVKVTASEFPVGTIITVKGVVDYYNGSYQLKVFSYKDITFE